jgi:hypothetical protein
MINDNNLTPFEDYNIDGKSFINVIHTCRNGPSVDIFVDDRKIIDKCEYGTRTDFQQIDSGSHHIIAKIADRDITIAKKHPTLYPYRRYNIIFHNRFDFQVDLTIDEERPEPTYIENILSFLTQYD